MNRRFIYSLITQLSLAFIVLTIAVPVHLNAFAYILLLFLFILAVQAYDESVDNRRHKR